jgi:GT2 family glycosyltransferase
MTGSSRILILTPVKDAAKHLEAYFAGLLKLTYPKELISLGILEGDSCDHTYELALRAAGAAQDVFSRVNVWKKDFGFHIPPGVERWAPAIQLRRRGALAKARNHLLFHSLEDEDWVLWLDVDVVEYPANIIEKLLAAGKDIVQPHCVREYGGPTFDLNAWRAQGTLHLEDLRTEGELVELDSVGGTMLLVRADRHRDGLVFPCFPYGKGNARIRRNNYWMGEIETEGLGIMADDMGVKCWGMPRMEIKHHRS